LYKYVAHVVTSNRHHKRDMLQCNLKGRCTDIQSKPNTFPGRRPLYRVVHCAYRCLSDPRADGHTSRTARVCVIYSPGYTHGTGNTATHVSFKEPQKNSIYSFDPNYRHLAWSLPVPWALCLVLITVITCAAFKWRLSHRSDDSEEPGNDDNGP